MRALTVTPGVKNSIKLAQIREPVPTASQALLRVREIGVCGTDMDLNQGFYGEAPPGSSYLVTGHESLSTVESIPKNDQGISKGDLVVPTVRRPDDCINCQHGERSEQPDRPSKFPDRSWEYSLLLRGTRALLRDNWIREGPHRRSPGSGPYRFRIHRSLGPGVVLVML